VRTGLADYPKSLGHARGLDGQENDHGATVNPCRLSVEDLAWTARRLLSLLNRSAKSRFQPASEIYLAGGASLLALCAALAVLDVERSSQDASIIGLGDAIWRLSAPWRPSVTATAVDPRGCLMRSRSQSRRLSGCCWELRLLCGAARAVRCQGCVRG
jgi:hypothetical protein